MGSCENKKKKAIKEPVKVNQNEKLENPKANDNSQKTSEDAKTKQFAESKNQTPTDKCSQHENISTNSNTREKSNENIESFKNCESADEKGNNNESINNKEKEEKNGNTLMKTGDTENKNNEKLSIKEKDEEQKNRKDKKKPENQKINDEKKENKKPDEKNKHSRDNGYIKNEYGEFGYYGRFDNYLGSIRKKGVIGLRNLTNTCFMNSSLQCLSHIKPFYEKIKKEKKLGKLGLAFYELLVKMYGDNLDDKSYTPSNILDEMSLNFKQYQEKRQQGANEFINNFLTLFHEEINSDNHAQKDFDLPKNELLKKKFEKKYEYYLKNKSIIIDLFYGNMVRQTICKACKNPINALFSIFNILELSIYKNRKENEIFLESLFKSYFTEQDDEYPMFCKNCGKEGKSYSKTEIVHCPDILIIYINKVIDNKYYDNFIYFPNSLELKNYISQDTHKQKTYDLIGFIEHAGSEYGGHYTSKCKNFEDEKWYKFNDSFADQTTVPQNIDKSNTLIILFYQRRNLD